MILLGRCSTMTSHDQVRRMLAEVPYLQAHPGVSVADVANTFGITAKQVLRDLDVLWMCGLPGGLPGDLIDIDMDGAKGEGTIRLSNAEFLSRPMTFTPDEATSLLVALRAVEELGAPSMADAAIRAAHKLNAAVPQSRASQVDVAMSTGASALRERLLRAIDDGQRLVLEYDNAHRDETTHPVVDPVAIQMRDGAAYLCAWSVERNDWRRYRLDRIVTAEPEGNQAESHGLPPAVDEWFTADDAQVTLDLAASARWVVEYYPTTSVSDLPDGSLRAVFPVGDPGWVKTMLLRLGDGVLRVDPAPAALPAARAAEAALALNTRLAGADA